MNKSKKIAVDPIVPPTYTKMELYHSEHYKHQKDLITALLKEGRTYSFEEADRIIDKFMKGKVR